MSKLVGQWASTQKMLRRVQRQGIKQSRDASTKLARKVYRKIIQHVHDQDLSWAPLAPSTRAKKGSDSAWVEDGALMASVQINVLEDTGSRMTMVIGPTGTHPHAGVSNQELAGMLENGSTDGTIVPRPLFGPTYEEVLKGVHTDVEAMLHELTRDT